MRPTGEHISFKHCDHTVKVRISYFGRGSNKILFFLFHCKEKIVKKLASDDAVEQEKGMLMADNILDGNSMGEITEMGEIRIKCDRTVINKFPNTDDNADPSRMSRGDKKMSFISLRV